jgi:hypothetical protein
MYVTGKLAVWGKCRVLVVNASGTYSYHFVLGHTHELSVEKKDVTCRTKKITTLGEKYGD